MAATSYKDRISETSTFTGGGPVALLGAVNGFADFTRFAASQSGIPVLMEAIDAAHAPTGQWEVAMCTLSADRRTLTRDAVRDSSNAGATVSFAAGTKRVSVVNDGLSIENRLIANPLTGGANGWWFVPGRGLTFSDPSQTTETDIGPGTDATDGGAAVFATSLGYLFAGYTDAWGPYLRGAGAPIWVDRTDGSTTDTIEPVMVLGQNKDPVLTTATGLEAVDASAEDWGPGVKRALADGLIVGDQAAGQADIALFAGDSTYTGQLEIDNLDWSGAAVFGGRVTPEGRVPLVTAGAFTGFMFTNTPYVMADAILTEATGLKVQPDEWWDPATADCYVGSSFAVGDGMVEGSVRMYKAQTSGGVEYSAGLEIDQYGTGGGGFAISIPGSHNAGPVEFGRYGPVSGYHFDSDITTTGGLATNGPYGGITTSNVGANPSLQIGVNGTAAYSFLQMASSGTITAQLSAGSTGAAFDADTIYLRNFAGSSVIAQFDVNAFLCTSPSMYFGRNGGVAADLAITYNHTNYYHTAIWQTWRTGSAIVVGARMVSEIVGGIRHSTAAHTFTNLDASHTYAILDDAGARFSVGGMGIFNIHSQGFSVSNAISCGISAGSSAAPADVAIYFDTTNYYNILTFRKWDGTAYSTHASIVGSAGNGLTLGGYPGYIFYAGSSTAPTTVGTLDTTGLHITGDVKASNGVHGNSGNATNATNRNPGLYSYNNNGDVTAGMELGYNSGYGYTNRIFAHPSWAITLCGITGGGNLQSHFEDWAVVSAGGINLPAGSTYKINGVAIGGGSGGLTDGDKGDVVVGGSGTTLTVESATPASGAFQVTGVGQFSGYLISTALLCQSSTGFFGPFSSTSMELCANSVVGAYLSGCGTTYDLSLANRAGTSIINILAGTTTVSFAGDVSIVGKVSLADEVYSAAWDGKLEAPTKNAVYDKIQTLGAGGTTTNPLTINNSGTGIASGGTFDGSVARTISYNSIGAAKAGAFSASLLTLNTAKIIGRTTAANGAPEEVGVDATLTLTALNLGVAKVPTALTVSNAGGGAASGSTFDGSVARTISYNSIGATRAGLATAGDLTMNTGKVLGRTTAAAGAIEELTPGATMTIAAGALNVAKVPNALTGNNSGTGVASGGTYDGSAAVTFSWNTLGAAPDAPRTQAAAAESITPTFSNDVVQRLACVASITLNNPTGTAVDNWGLVVKLRSASAQALSYGTQYRAVGVVLPAATIAGKLLILGMIWNVTDTKFDVVAVAQEA
jgi:hypothetical protein